MTTNKILCASLAAAALACAFPAAAKTVKIGLISSYSGPGAAQGDQIDKGQAPRSSSARATIPAPTATWPSASPRS